MSKSDGFFAKFLTSLTWSKVAHDTNKTIVAIDQTSKLARYLHALSYSEHEVKAASRKTHRDIELTRISAKFEKLWGIAQLAMKERKFVRAEAALLKIIELDQLNATAYNRLGILYAKSASFDDSIRCFKLASKLEPSASSYHNLALIYYETGKYKSSLKHFLKALKYDDSYAPRYIAIAKVYEKLGNEKQVIHNLEHAAKLDPTKQTQTLLYSAYKTYGYSTEASKIERQMLDSLHQDVKEVKELEHAKLSEKSIFSSSISVGYQY